MNMKNKNSKIGTLIVLSLLLSGLSFILTVKAQAKDAYFTSIKVTHGTGVIELIGGGTAKVYDAQRTWVNLTYYNDKAGILGAYLYTKIYRGGSLVGKSGEDWILRWTYSTDYWSTYESGPAVWRYKVELWWNNGGTHILEDVKSFDVWVVKLFADWQTPSVTLEKGKTAPSTLSIGFGNGGNDYMYSVDVSLIDSAGLEIAPWSQSLGDITSGGTKSMSFSVRAPGNLGPGIYTLTFRVTYNDFRGVSYSEIKTASINVTRLSTKSTISVPSTEIQGTQTAFTATLKDGNENPLSGETVEFYMYEQETWKKIGSANTDSNGVATVLYTPTSTGTFQVKATYSGTQNYAESTSTISVITVSPASAPTPTPTDYTPLYIVSGVIVLVLSGTIGYMIFKRKRETTPTTR
jgi:hypothetical protein